MALSGAFGPWAAVIDSPLSIPGPVDDVVASFKALLASVGGDTALFMTEEPFYAAASRYLPPFSVQAADPSGSVQALALFGPAAGLTWLGSLPEESAPGMHFRSRAPVAGGRERAPGTNGEVKSLADGRVIAQALTYLLMDLVRIFFPALGPDGRPARYDSGRRPAPPTFFEKPPVGYMLIGFAHVGYYLSVEWIGPLLIAPASAPFFFGSDAHRAAAAALPDVHYGAPLVLSEDAQGAFVAETGASKGASAVWPLAWTTREVGGRFYKVVRGHAHGAEFFTNLYATYARLSTLLRADDRPAALVTDVTLRFGAYQVLVDMPFIHGRHASDVEMVSDAVLKRIATAVAWLAANKLIYCDVRGLNVIIGERDGHAYLVDYDDCFLIDAPVKSYDAYTAALRTRQTKVAAEPLMATFSSELCAGRLPEMTAALRVAFAALAQS